MIYTKINKNLYNESQSDKITEDYPLWHSKAILRIVKHTLLNELKDYPEIDIVLSSKSQKYCLGRFCKNGIVKHKEYNFTTNNTPYIVLFIHKINSFYCNHFIKGLKQVLLHEFTHYKQWLLNEKIRHTRELKAIASVERLNSDIRVLTDVLNCRG